MSGETTRNSTPEQKPFSWVARLEGAPRPRAVEGTHRGMVGASTDGGEAETGPVKKIHTHSVAL
jgi:hypothetical protein